MAYKGLTRKGSKSFNVRMSDEELQRIKIFAEENQTSMGEVVRFFVKKGLDRVKKTKIK